MTVTRRAVRAEAFRDAADLVRRMARNREDMMWRGPWPVSLPHEITALENAAAMLGMIALGYEMTRDRRERGRQ